MQLRSAIVQLLVYAIYPAWLVAGAIDYVCHRRTQIETTSGAAESDFHVAQFCTIAIIVGGAVLLRPSMLVACILGIVVVLHTVLAYLDVRYTQTKRHISALEQQAHAFMDVLPIIAVALFGVLAIDQDEAAPWSAFELRESVGWPAFAIVGSFLVLAGVPILEEWLRTLRAQRKPTAEMIAMR